MDLSVKNSRIEKGSYFDYIMVKEERILDI